MTLVVTPLHDNEFLVSGTDSMGVDNSTVLESESWAAYLYVQKFNQVTDAFNDKVKAGFAWLTEAADEAKAALDEDEDYSVVVVSTGVEGKPEEKVHLDRNGRLLNMLAKGKSDKLRWVGDRLVATK